MTTEKHEQKASVINNDNINHEEKQYLNLVKEIIEKGVKKSDRTGIGTLSIFGPTNMRFNLRNGRFPLLTTKRVFWRGVVEELLWIISGKTDANILDEKNVKIWNDNGTREFLDKLGFTKRQEGDLGPIYGFQWRHCGAKYIDCKTDYTDQGIDQLAQLIHMIKTDPDSRRLVLCAWNVSQIPEMALPPCHVLCQFNVSASKELSCLMYQRSCDLGLGVPFNIASYSLLTYMIAHVCDLTPGDFIHTMGDAHVYLNHVEPLREQIQREPQAFPTLTIVNKRNSIDDFQAADFKLENYLPDRPIKMQMAV
ncbi:unnamed protein product [Rotaria sp. Silwood2]|nr:unnamed protein product [Rotaria sp. Silwood2]CAF2899859.1 unnamed protein product [Rotaria sp. Silwood2]CAF3924533.1 unnamed protein product [Rotaria sp. Silwood2]CAF3952354.1 unnamed protein product [Rotaria sp. Silwood2]CAF4085718.1 unnamed protein product [Rotaria sp. Silwood2]